MTPGSGALKIHPTRSIAPSTACPLTFTLTTLPTRSTTLATRPRRTKTGMVTRPATLSQYRTPSPTANSLSATNSSSNPTPPSETKHASQKVSRPVSHSQHTQLRSTQHSTKISLACILLSTAPGIEVHLRDTRSLKSRSQRRRAGMDRRRQQIARRRLGWRYCGVQMKSIVLQRSVSGLWRLRRIGLGGCMLRAIVGRRGS